MNTSIEIILNGEHKSLNRDTRKYFVARRIARNGYGRASSSPDGTFL